MIREEKNYTVNMHFPLTEVHEYQFKQEFKVTGLWFPGGRH